jgi:hypothetical protein
VSSTTLAQLRIVRSPDTNIVSTLARIGSFPQTTGTNKPYKIAARTMPFSQRPKVVEDCCFLWKYRIASSRLSVCAHKPVGPLFISRTKSAVSAAKSAFNTLLFGCMTISHPAGNSPRWHRTISRTRRRIRLRTTAPPNAFLMLKPKRLSVNWLARKKRVKKELDRRFPVR